MKRFATLSMLLLGAFMITLFSSFDIKGNGNVISQKRDISNFTSIDVSNGFDVIISQGNECTVEVEADENLHKVIITKVKNGVLHVYADENIRKAKKTAIYISFKDLESLDVSGAVDLESAGVINANELYVDCSGASDVELYLQVNKLKLDVSGASDLDLEGTAAHFNADVSGASDIDAFQLHADNVSVDASGASSIDVHAVSTFEAESSGASDIRYKGDPKVNRVSTSGAGDVHRL